MFLIYFMTRITKNYINLKYMNIIFCVSFKNVYQDIVTTKIQIKYKREQIVRFISEILQNNYNNNNLKIGGPGTTYLSHLPIRSKLCLTKGWVALTARVTSLTHWPPDPQGVLWVFYLGTRGLNLFGGWFGGLTSTQLTY